MARALTEGELVALAQSGDGDAYASLVRAHSDIAFRTAMLITQDAAEAEEAAQDAFLKAWRALGRFRPDEPLRPWLLKIVANEARNRRRSAGRRGALALRVRPSAAAERSAEAQVIAAETRAALLAGARAPARRRPARARLPLPARALRGRDRGGARRAAGHGQVPDLPRPGAPARGGDAVNDLEQCPARARRGVAGDARSRHHHPGSPRRPRGTPAPARRLARAARLRGRRARAARRRDARRLARGALDRPALARAGERGDPRAGR